MHDVHRLTFYLWCLAGPSDLDHDACWDSFNLTGCGDVIYIYMSIVVGRYTLIIQCDD